MERLFAESRQFLSTYESDNQNEESTDAITGQLESALVIVEEGIQMLQDSQYCGELQVLNSMRQTVIRYMRQIIYGHNDCTIPAVGIQPFRIYLHSGNVGRPRLLVNIEQVELLRGCGYTWHEVSECLCVSRSTIWRRLRELNISLEKYSDISDFELDELVTGFHRHSPNAGQMMMQGFLLQRGVNVQRYRIRQSIARTDPLRRSLRWHQAVLRRTYSVKGANSLWHIDGHHSLIRWRFVVHGGIDGYSRLIVFLNCNTNNRASTVMHEFRKGTEQYGIPSRVRSDKGGENVDVCYFMVAHRGADRTSHIAGSSVHNQRIERLWRDVYRCVCCTYHQVFYEMETLEILNPDSEADLFVLHCIYLPVIRKHLLEFSRAWNRHPMRTERNWSPWKIWINSTLRDSVDTSFDMQQAQIYGIDSTGPLPEEDQFTVHVPEVDPPLHGDRLEQFITSIHTHSAFHDDYGISHYREAKGLLETLLNA